MRTLVAGIGNVFLRDDGFGVEVAARLARQHLGEGVRVLDIGVRARHLAYELADGGYDQAILVDAVARGGTAGTLYLVEPELPPASIRGGPTIDGHALNPDSVLQLVGYLGGPTRVLIVGCEPAHLDEGMGLSPAVAAAVDEAVALVRSLVCA